MHNCHKVKCIEYQLRKYKTTKEYIQNSQILSILDSCLIYSLEITDIINTPIFLINEEVLANSFGLFKVNILYLII